MPKWFAPVLLVSLCMFALGVAGLVVVSGMGREETPLDDDPFAQDQGLDQLEILDFRLFDQTGEIIEPSILDGEITIANFFFTNCVLVCPQMNGEMYNVTTQLDDTGVRFLSFSVDPEHDTLEVIREYADRFGVEDERWRFLTGDREQIERLVRDGILFHLGDDPDEENRIELPSGESMANVLHPSKFFLIGPDRRILGLYSYLFQEDLDALVDRARTLDRLNG